VHWFAFEQLDAPTLYDVLALRQAIFVVEQDCAYLDADGLDRVARHLVHYDERGLAATLRTFAPGQQRAEAVVGRVVVRADLRGAGVGRAVMEEAHAELRRQHGPIPIFLSAQAHLQGWYASLGYAVCGAGYLEDGIPHLPMRREAEPG
jgi:ElaA protein